ncbi:hypothetical protein H9P43_000708 [Blastocladiella emersonii ATCC 22665]|nr:hypothetical protein H9P43_000708 [Blastocladiella emersonii ATCC 22665]
MAVDKKTQKYDRQLRLWQAHGQAALERAHVCLVNGTATGTEVLKNLVLPGVGAFTVVDGSTVTPADIGNNFFVKPAHLGQNRAKVVSALLGELNEDVDARFVAEDVAELVHRNPAFFHAFSLVVVTGRVPMPTLLALDAECWPRGIPLLVLRNAGFAASLRSVLRAHHVVELHPDSPARDLRLADPWPELVAFVDGFKDFDAMSSAELTHVPYPVILLRVYRQWRAKVGNDAPNSGFRAYLTAEKERHAERLVAVVTAQLQKDAKADGGAAGDVSEAALATATATTSDLENWDEAIANAYHAYSRPSVDSAVTKLFEYLPAADAGEDAATSESTESKLADLVAPEAAASGGVMSTRPATFWSLVGALRAFLAQSGGQLPLRGVVPDMKADTTTYVAMQRTYRAKAAADLASLRALLKPITVGGVTATPDAVDDDALAQFARNANYLRLVTTPSLRDEYTRAHPDRVRDLTSEMPANELAVLVLFRAVDYFYAAHRRWPGDHAEEFDGDAAQLRIAVRDALRALAHGAPLPAEIASGDAAVAEPSPSAADTPIPTPSINLDDWVHEFVRAGPAELHGVAAYMGGVAAQEAIKLITSQYLPMAGTYVYNAIASQSSVIA